MLSNDHVQGEQLVWHFLQKIRSGWFKGPRIPGARSWARSCGQGPRRTRAVVGEDSRREYIEQFSWKWRH